MKNTIPLNSKAFMAVVMLAFEASTFGSEGLRPIADAGLSRYAAIDPIVLDGTGSYDPDSSAPLTYMWQQIAGPSVLVDDANTATPTISGFVQTNKIQECEFELVVSDGQYESLPDTVEVKVVPFFIAVEMFLANETFDPDKPTIIYFGGGDGANGLPQYAQPPWDSAFWGTKANLFSFPDGYRIDSGSSSPSYNRLGDAIISYLSATVPDYKEPIQTIGWSTGGLPAIKVATYLNQTYRDRRYAVNRVTGLDAAGPGASEMISQLLENSVDGEPCWLDSYVSTSNIFYDNILNVGFSGGSHELARDWYGNSLSVNSATQFNGGIVGGAYWSVIGPGKNLQLASTPGTKNYIFKWYGSATSGHMDFYSESNYPGRLPEPVTLVGPIDGAFIDANGAILTCEESENAVGYQLLFGPDPHRVMDYMIISDTSTPPSEVITTFPFKKTWWTVKVRDQFGSTIYADPILINAEKIESPIELVQNVTTGKTYHSIQDAIDEAVLGDEIVVSAGTFLESINFSGKNVTLRSTNPDDPAIVATTIIYGIGSDPIATFSSGEDLSCVFAGFTIINTNNGIYCSGSSPTILGCNIAANDGVGIELHMGSNPTITNCCITDNTGPGIEMHPYKPPRSPEFTFNQPTITNCTVTGNLQNGISGGKPTITNSIIWANSPQQIEDTQGTISYSAVQGDWPGEGNIDADPLFANPEDGDYHLRSQAGRYDPNTGAWIVDDVTSPCIDAGDPSNPIGLEPVPNGGRINMGTFGGTIEASMSP